MRVRGRVEGDKKEKKRYLKAREGLIARRESGVNERRVREEI